MDTAEILLSINKKLDKISEVKPLWVNAEMIKDKTGLNDDGMKRLRAHNPNIWKLKKTGGYLYNISAIPAVMIKQNV